ncbi:MULTISPECIES: flagellar basal body rod protein FlgB [Bacillales]|jgi:flagellar basal-body rod protein FlgB|uniref:Flagellar basal body rod protein FlgB n=1 Tax=Brevibacillus aydinogluensis TaxID=927786 RepID=A0AA48RHK7_9BACL|nr:MULTISPECIES: flagellar basal body rod protein FlgB [Bacillales]REK64218.1 MAG: flagellar basal body rod protein FlgB [Brevibacillus sp.]MDT3415030.1 flagellar basal-body rod protein FlgB [Brevibacillus aydinogluensis]NNV01797.1 flagellar basal body rod protein FlgB [Brevibacillus sp. MCWH]UFJ60839.1 flagellar basal body rod protein FlgB [Anoxybacillus sediminis]CAJ1002427.1 flagellar basal body rod protein FlgB [Brevibacillus aydinogluensis]
MLESVHLQVLERSLDTAMLRQRTIANNIANVDTPQFKSKRVVFEELLQQELAGTAGLQKLEAYRTNERHIPFNRMGTLPMPQILSNVGNMMQHNGNDVDLEFEMNELAKNQIWYNGLTQLTAGYFQKLRSVLEGGGR